MSLDFADLVKQNLNDRMAKVKKKMACLQENEESRGDIEKQILLTPVDSDEVI